jgi:hypothetical protein
MKKQRKTKKTDRPKVLPSQEKAEAAKELFEQGILTRGEAAPADKEGKLPMPYTHEIVDGKIVRRRFSIS